MAKYDFENKTTGRWQIPEPFDVRQYDAPIKMYEEPLKIATDGMIVNVVQNFGFDVDKEELYRALKYDRDQYEKGYSKGKTVGIDEFRERIKELLKHGIFVSRNDLFECITGIAEELRGEKYDTSGNSRDSENNGGELSEF